MLMIIYSGSPSTQSPGTPPTPHTSGSSSSQRRISHSIAHRYEVLRQYSSCGLLYINLLHTYHAFRFHSKLVLPGMCNYCRKIMVSGMVCRYCRYACHTKCSKLVPPTCGLPKEYEDFFKVNVPLSMGGIGIQ